MYLSPEVNLGENPVCSHWVFVIFLSHFRLMFLMMGLITSNSLLIIWEAFSCAFQYYIIFS
jgi:hypothetical protein